MKKHRNSLLVVLQSRIRQLLARYEESTSIAHAATQGSLREGYLTSFLADVMPISLQTSGGFVTDSRGETISPQIDLLVYEPSLLPAALLDARVAVLPIEVALVAFEVKSVIESATVSQVSRQQESFRQLRYSWTAPKREYLLTTNCAGIPQFVIAFDSKVSKDTAENWFKVESHLSGVCVVGKWLLYRDPGDQSKIHVVDSDAGHSEVLHLLPFLLTTLETSKTELQSFECEIMTEVKRVFSPDLGAYLTFDVPMR